MNKSIIGFILGCLLSCCVMVFAGNAIKTIDVMPNEVSIAIKQDSGEINKLNVDNFVLVDKGLTYVPLRAISEAIGLKVDWDADTKAIVISKDLSDFGRAAGLNIDQEQYRQDILDGKYSPDNPNWVDVDPNTYTEW